MSQRKEQSSEIKPSPPKRPSGVRYVRNNDETAERKSDIKPNEHAKYVVKPINKG